MTRIHELKRIGNNDRGNGLEKFKEHFAGFEDNYVIIGGTACDIALRDTVMRPRATDDIDMILVVEK